MRHVDSYRLQSEVGSSIPISSLDGGGLGDALCEIAEHEKGNHLSCVTTLVVVMNDNGCLPSIEFGRNGGEMGGTDQRIANSFKLQPHSNLKSCLYIIPTSKRLVIFCNCILLKGWMLALRLQFQVVFPRGPFARPDTFSASQSKQDSSGNVSIAWVWSGSDQHQPSVAVAVYVTLSDLPLIQSATFMLPKLERMKSVSSHTLLIEVAWQSAWLTPDPMMILEHCPLTALSQAWLGHNTIQHLSMPHLAFGNSKSLSILPWSSSPPV